MNNKTQKLIGNLNESFSGKPWLGNSLLENLNAIDYKLVNQTMGNSGNSIAILVQHIINWRIFVVEKLEGNELFEIELNSEKDWTKISVENEAEWNELLEKLASSQSQIIKILSDKTNDNFLDDITLGEKYSLEYLIEGIIQHDIYHSGQIGILNSQLK
jgi:uncharacterized damage-inducible protein DinB